MFGYIRPQKAELLVKEYEQYRGIYCALCKHLGKNYGVLARMTLSYDCTFLVMLEIGLSGTSCSFFNGKCVVNPLKKCAYCKGGNSEFRYASALSVIMSYYKLKDDIRDSKLPGRIRAFLLLPFFFHSHKKAAKEFPVVENCVARAMVRQEATEQMEKPGIDVCAEPTARMLAEIFSNIASGDRERRILEQFGYFLRRWIYLIDAADDIEKDLNDRSFNPFVLKRELTSDSSLDDISNAKAYANEVLNMTLSQAIGAFQLLEFQQFGKILSNVLLLGLPEMQKELLFLKEKKKNV